MSNKQPNICLLMMVKNEEDVILKTLESVIGTVNSIVIYDTGSVDDTIKIITEFSDRHKDITLRIKNGEFVDFSTSRNIAIEFAEEDESIDFLLLLDANDVLQDGDKLIEFATAELNNDENKSSFEYGAYMIKQRWYYSSKHDDYFNTRFFRPRLSWKYQRPVHEYLYRTDGVQGTAKHATGGVITQDRNIDAHKSYERFKRDKDILMKEHLKDPSDARTVFYLAQTYSGLGMSEEAYHYYKLRTHLEGFYEEVFQSYVKLGDIATLLDMEPSVIIKWYTLALHKLHRLEPVNKLAEFYLFRSNLSNSKSLAWMYTSLAQKMKPPTDALLWVDKDAYYYKRYHLHGIAAYYCNEYESGSIACKIAIARKGLDVDKNNLKFYDDKLSIKD